MRIVIVLTFLMFVSRDAYAYLDPGSMSYVIQLIIAGLAAAFLAIKSFWHQITSLLMRIFTGPKGRDKITK